jgi:hypothetical protein
MLELIIISVVIVVVVAAAAAAASSSSQLLLSFCEELIAYIHSLCILNLTDITKKFHTITMIITGIL